MKRRQNDDDDANSNKSPTKKHRQSSIPSLNVGPTTRFEGKFPFFRQPSEIGSFSLDSERSFVCNRSQLRYFCPPHGYPDKVKKLEWDLRKGYNTFIQRDQSVKEKLDDLLRWVKEKRDVFHDNSDKDGKSKEEVDSLHTDFICWRGLLTKLLCTPYEGREGWKIAIARYNGTVYLCDLDTDQKLNDPWLNDPKQKEMTYWGFKFEQYITSDTENGVADTSSPVSNKSAFVSVVRTRLNKHSIVFGGEVDCCEPHDSSRYLELKTSREFSSEKQRTNFKKFKLIKWWAQSYLIGIPQVVCGFRGDDGVVRRLQAFKTNDIPKQCADVPSAWNPSVCFNFVDVFLQYVTDNITADYDSAVYVLDWMPRQPITCAVHPPDSEYAFLPAWYTALAKRDAGKQTDTDAGKPTDT